MTMTSRGGVQTDLDLDDQDVREKAAWDAVDAESRRRVAGRLPHGWTLEKKGRERTIYINPKGSKTYSRPELKSQSCVLL